MRIVVAEDSTVIQAGLVEILADRGHQIVAAVGDAEDLRRPWTSTSRTLPSWTCGCRPATPTRASGRLSPSCRDHPGTGVLVFSQYIETRHAAELLERQPAAVPPVSDTCSRTASAMWANSSMR